MTDAIPVVPHLAHGKHNMASEAFEALRTARADGIAPKGGELTFSDFIDTLNPLQHIPVVSGIYRHLTGDTISPAARVAGGTLYGGPIGLVGAMLDSAMAAATGGDLGEHVIAALTGGETETRVAEAAVPSSGGPGPSAGRIAAMAQAASADTGITASLSKPGPSPAAATAAVPKALPQLSSDAFNALVNSFADPDAAKTANPALAARTSPEKSGMETAAPNDLIGAMQNGLDQLDALKRAPGSPMVSAFAPSEASGF